MPFQKIAPEKLSHSVVQQMELLILRGILRPGERLPSERELSDKLGVSRPSLREAVADLQDRGLLTSRPNAGIFVADVLGSAFAPALVDLFSAHEEAVFDYVSFRRDIEGIAAARAATVGSDTDIQVISAIFAKMEQAHDMRDAAVEAELDANFHMAIIEASHNVVLLHMMRSMYDLLRQGVFYNRQIMFKSALTRDHLLDQHRAILQAIQTRNAELARQTVEAHMDFVTQSMADQLRTARNEAVARQRLDHEMSRTLK